MRILLLLFFSIISVSVPAQDEFTKTLNKITEGWKTTTTPIQNYIKGKKYSPSVSIQSGYDYSSHTLSVRIFNYSSTTINKVSIIVSVKDLSRRYDPFDTIQYRYNSYYLDVNIPSGHFSTESIKTYIDNSDKFNGVILDWARGINNEYVYSR